jgi:hypothetical protein
LFPAGNNLIKVNLDLQQEKKMIKKNNYLSRTVLALLVVVFLSAFGVSAPDCQVPIYTPIADVIIEPGGVLWVPRVSYAMLEVTISRPDGTIYNQSFKAGNTPQVGLSKILGESYCDGSYIFELRVTPSLDFKQRSGEEVEIRYSQRALVQTGGFSVYKGEIVVQGEEEPEKAKGASFSTGHSISTTAGQNGVSRTMDFVINDDLIVDGSACIGFDCVNGESFGFDTLRLKENNLRIKFDDTSTAASFPRNDWQLTANDSANGGASKFSIDDISGSRTPFTVEANARSHSLYVDDGGRIGIRTSTPSVEIHVIDGDTPALRLQQDGSSGFAPQTWDVAGNETNFFIRDVTNGSTLPFRIRPSAPTSSIFIDVDGDVGLGTSSPDASLHVMGGDDTSGILLETSSGTDAVLTLERPDGATNFISASGSHGFFGTTSDHPLRFNVNGGWKMQLNQDNSLDMQSGATCTSGGVWTSVSTREAKENIKNLTSNEAIAALDGLNPVKFNYKAEKEEKYVGFIAEDVPELVASKDRKRLTSMDIVAVLTKVVKEQQKMMQEQKKNIAQLKKEIDELKKK